MPSRPLVAVVVALFILAFGLTLVDAAVIPLLAVLPLFVSFRAVFGGVDVSWSDIALATAFVPAVLFGRRPYSAPLRTLLWLTAVYQVATLFTVVANPYSQNTIEWFHAWLLTGGALVVGWTIGREGHARAGLSLVLIGSVFLAVICIVQGMSGYLRGDFGAVFPSWPFPMHKNFAGCRPRRRRRPRLRAARVDGMAQALVARGLLDLRRRDPGHTVAPVARRACPGADRAGPQARSPSPSLEGHPGHGRPGSRARRHPGSRPARVREPVQLRESEVELVRGLRGGLESAALGGSRLAMVVHRPVPVRLPASQRRDGGPQQHRSHRPGRLPGPDAGRTGRALEDGSGLRHAQRSPYWAADSCRASWTCSGWRRRPPSRSSSSASASARKRSTPATPTTPRPPRPSARCSHPGDERVAAQHPARVLHRCLRRGGAAHRGPRRRPGRAGARGARDRWPPRDDHPAHR